MPHDALIRSGSLVLIVTGSVHHRNVVFKRAINRSLPGPVDRWTSGLVRQCTGANAAVALFVSSQVFRNGDLQKESFSSECCLMQIPAQLPSAISYAISYAISSAISSAPCPWAPRDGARAAMMARTRQVCVFRDSLFGGETKLLSWHEVDHFAVFSFRRTVLSVGMPTTRELSEMRKIMVIRKPALLRE